MRLGIPFNKAGAVRVCLDALKNVGILKENGGEYSLTDFTGKADLRNCEILQKLSYIY